MTETVEIPKLDKNASGEEDPYRLEDYKSDVIPTDGGNAPVQKTAEPDAYHDNRIYVSNIPFTFTDEDLISLFGRFGNVKSAMIVCNERGSKGFGFVTMDSVDSCEKARAALHGTRILGRIIEVRKATPLSKPVTQRRSQPQLTPTNCSPRRPVARTIPRRKPVPMQAQIAINPNIMPMGMLPPNIQAQCMSPHMMASPLLQQTALNVLLGENPVLLQNLLSPYALAARATQSPQSSFFTPTPMYHSPMPQNPFVTLPGAPLTQPQPGFAYRVATLPQQNFVSESNFFVCGAQQGVYSHDPTQSFIHNSAGSLNNTLLNSTLLSASMNAHMQGMQENLVNLLNLDGTLMSANHSKAANSKNNSTLSDSGNCPELNESGRKRRAAAAEVCLDPDDGNGSPAKRFLL